MDCVVHGVAKSRTLLSDFHFHARHNDRHWDLLLMSLTIIIVINVKFLISSHLIINTESYGYMTINGILGI